MSEIYYTFDQTDLEKNTSNSYFTTIHNISQATQEDIEALIQYLETSKRPYLFDFMNLSDDIIKDYNLSMCILYGKIGIHKKSHEYLNKYIERHPNCSSFYRCLRDILYIKYIDQKVNNSFLFKLYDTKTIDDIYSALEQDRFLELFHLSSCFDCEKCGISNSCKLLNLIEISKRIEKAFEKNIPDQKLLARYFH